MDQMDGLAVRRCIGANVRRVDRIITQLYEEAMAPVNIRNTQFTLLATLAAAGTPLTIHQLASYMVMDRTTLTRNLGPMLKQGWVNIETGKDDQRTRIITLTPAGEAILDRALPLWKEAQKRVIDFLGEERAARFLQDMLDVVDLVH